MTDQPAMPSSMWPFRGRSPVLKVVAILALVVAFIVPLTMIHGVIGEREGRRLGVVNEIGDSLGAGAARLRAAC